MESAQPPAFLLAVERRIVEASDMVSAYLDASTKASLLSVVHSRMLQPHVPQLISRGLPALLADVAADNKLASASANVGAGGDVVKTAGQVDRMPDLKRMFSLVERVGALEDLKAAWNNFLKTTVEAVVVDVNREKTMVEELLVFHEKMESVLKGAFSSQEGFKYAMKNAFENSINLRQNKPAELMAKFVDRKMRGEKGVGDAELESLLERIMCLFRYLNGKDVFEAFYKKMLAKRLLLGKSANFEIEKNMLAKLKTECGYNFTAKLEGMFQDVELSRDVMSAYNEQAARESNIIVRPDNGDATMDVVASSSAGVGSGGDASGVVLSAAKRRSEPEMHVQVLTTGYWPTPPAMEGLVVPSELTSLQNKFESFYTSKYQGRRLTWAHSLERCILTARFPRGKKELEVSFAQATILLCFNRADRLQYPEILAMTHMEVGELKRTLQSLACGIVGTRVLTKDPKGRDVSDDDYFHFTSDFANKLFRIRINTIQLRETVEEAEQTHEEVFRERQYQVDAAIVRTMKARKTLSHNVLMSELMTQLRFPARAADLKKRIESLIEREYLTRDRDDSSMYVYLA